MRLLFITQEYNKNSPFTSFIPYWIKSAEKQFSSVQVFVLKKVDENKNVFEIKSFNKLFTFLKLNYLIFKNRKQFDVIVTHLSALFAIAAFPTARLFHKKLYMWYAHGKVPPALRIASLLVDGIFTASRDSFNIRTGKLNIIGHGIDIQNFKERHIKKIRLPDIKIISIGRISPIKNYLPLIKAIPFLLAAGLKPKITICGAIITKADRQYYRYLKNYADKNKLGKYINFLTGGVPYKKVNRILLESDLFINLHVDGGIGKAVLEAMLVGIPTIFCTPAYDKALSPTTLKYLKFKIDQSDDLAEKINHFVHLPEKKITKVKNELHNYVVLNHSLDNLWKKIAKLFSR